MVTEGPMRARPRPLARSFPVLGSVLSAREPHVVGPGGFPGIRQVVDAVADGDGILATTAEMQRWESLVGGAPAVMAVEETAAFVIFANAAGEVLARVPVRLVPGELVPVSRP
jgi:hypothetical protein